MSLKDEHAKNFLCLKIKTVEIDMEKRGYPQIWKSHSHVNDSKDILQFTGDKSQ